MLCSACVTCHTRVTGSSLGISAAAESPVALPVWVDAEGMVAGGTSACAVTGLDKMPPISQALGASVTANTAQGSGTCGVQNTLSRKTSSGFLECRKGPAQGQELSVSPQGALAAKRSSTSHPCWQKHGPREGVLFLPLAFLRPCVDSPWHLMDVNELWSGVARRTERLCPWGFCSPAGCSLKCCSLSFVWEARLNTSPTPNTFPSEIFCDLMTLLTHK